jgi:hypothetical protein
MREYAVEFGRDPSQIDLDGRVTMRGDDVDAWAETVSRWKEISATHVSINTMGDHVRDVDDHLKRLRRLTVALGRASAAVS